MRWASTGTATWSPIMSTRKSRISAPRRRSRRCACWAGSAATRGPVDGRLEVEHAFDQNRNAPLETETDGYTLVNASLDWHPLAENEKLTLGIAANNIFDVVARRHSSLLKDYAPLAGRDIRLTARLGF